MSNLSETEVFDRLQTSIGDAVQACQDLAARSVRGASYTKLRENLALIEGCCRQLAAFRGDTRWLPIGRVMAECHAKAGGWLRGYKHPITKARIATAPGEMNQLFLMLGMNLLHTHEAAKKIFSERTGKTGAILPDMPMATRREGRPGLTYGPKKRSGLILPARFG